jgi:pimeloyl-ACP methyl ester carboxylesterase
MDTYADDLAELIEALDLKDAVLIGHSTGGANSRAISAAVARIVWPRLCWWARYRR